MGIKENILDCAIIGSGISGIFASLYLKKAGVNPTEKISLQYSAQLNLVKQTLKKPMMK